MSYDYIAAGITIFNDIVYADGRRVEGIPGGGIYWTTYYLVVGMQNLAVKTGYSAVKTAAAIVLGIVLVGLIPQKVFRFLGARFSKGAARE